MDINPDPPRKRGKLTLAIDVGGSRLKAGLLDQNGEMVAGPNRVNTPPRPVPSVVVDALVGLAGPLGQFDRISVGFPGVVRHGQVVTAPISAHRNVGTSLWRHRSPTSSANPLG